MQNGQTKPKLWPLEYAQEVAKELMVELRPECRRIEVAGSVRRLAAEVGDLELLVIPSVPVRRDLFGDRHTMEELNQTDHRLSELMTANILVKRLNSRGSTMYGPKNKYMVHVLTGMPVDIFYTTADNWGMAMVVRTGPKGFVQKVMSNLQAKGLRGHAYGGITRFDGELVCPTEEIVFQTLGWPYIDASQRTG